MTKYILSPSFLLFFFIPSTANEFQPYALNGGLVCAVAGQDFVVVASDTRLTDGYEILTRNHLQSRLWVASGGCQSHTSSPFENGGSVILPSEENSSVRIDSSDEHRKINSLSPYIVQPPTFIASAGCSSDCEELKRLMRSEIASNIHWTHGKHTLSSSCIANLLGQTLYTRRSFPFYSFCILAGFDDASDAGMVHVYDAIGSHERVSVASAGTGREMLQPILDRLFASAQSFHSTRPHEKNEEDDLKEAFPRLIRDGRVVDASKQRSGLKLQPPVETCVKCNAEQAISRVVRSYRATAEREIAVGDDVVVCLVRKRRNQKVTKGDAEQHECTMELFRFPLKKH